MATLTFPPALRQGVITTPSVTLPAATTRIDLAVTLPVQADRDNPAATIEIRVEISRDGGTTWKAWTTAGWHGGTGFVSKLGVTNPPPTLTLEGATLSAIAGALTRAAFTIPVALTAGCVVTAT